MSFELPKLNYKYDELEPYIDSKTMEIHHTKHHNGYTTNLNNAISDSKFQNSGIIEILKNLDMTNFALRNNSGGYFNHCLFWETIKPNSSGNPSGSISSAIDKSFGSFDDFKEIFSKAAATKFGSGWAWLCVKKGGTLEVCSTSNQDNPIMPGIGCEGFPILGLDVWEHAYYLNYQNRRPDYIKAFFEIINWDKVEQNFTENS